MSVESALSYAALILADSDIEISSEKLFQLVTKANVEVESIWADIFAGALEGKDPKEYLFNIQAAPAAGSATGAAAGGDAAAAGGEAAAEEKKEEEAKEESDDDMGFGLFD